MRLGSGADLASASRAHYKHTVFAHIGGKECLCQAIDSKLYLVSPTNTWARFSTSVSGRASLLHFAELVSINISSILPVGKGCCCIRMRVRLKRLRLFLGSDGHLSARLGANLELAGSHVRSIIINRILRGCTAKIKIRHGAVPCMATSAHY